MKVTAEPSPLLVNRCLTRAGIFLCDERIESETAKKPFLLKLTKESQSLNQEQGNAMIAKFLAADEEIKARK